jgi:hypothetical protein
MLNKKSLVQKLKEMKSENTNLDGAIQLAKFFDFGLSQLETSSFTKKKQFLNMNTMAFANQFISLPPSISQIAWIEHLSNCVISNILPSLSCFNNPLVPGSSEISYLFQTSLILVKTTLLLKLSKIHEKLPNTDDCNDVFAQSVFEAYLKFSITAIFLNSQGIPTPIISPVN